MPAGTLRLERVGKSFGAVRALDDLSLDIPPGRVVGLLGPNGSGKTTAMRIVFGVVDADIGTVTYGGEPLTEDGRRNFGYMPEERGLYPDMVVRDQVVYFARLFGLAPAAARRRADELLERLGLGERADERLENLSLGNQQRVQLAVALAHEPEALVLDEPFSGLDPVAVADLSEIVRDAAERGCTVVFSSHQLDLVEHLCEEVRVLDGGRLVMEGAVADLKRESGRRELRVAVDDPARLEGLAGPGVPRVVEGRVSLPLAAGADPLELLDAVRARARVDDFSLEQPRLSELFLEAVAR